MKFYRPLSTMIATLAIVTLVACDSDDDDSTDSGNTQGADTTQTDTDSGNTEGADTTQTDTDTGTMPTQVLLFDEATDGDIVNDPNNPLPLQFVVGENSLTAAVVSPDLDYITVNVPAGSELTAIELVDYTSTDDRSFIAIQSGSVFTVLPENAMAETGNLLGYLHFGEDMIGADILSEIGQGMGSQTFTPPLEAGDYTFWIQETGDSVVDFSLNFVVEPSS